MRQRFKNSFNLIFSTSDPGENVGLLLIERSPLQEKIIYIHVQQLYTHSLIQKRSDETENECGRTKSGPEYSSFSS